MQETTIYVELLDEGTIVFAPVPAVLAGKHCHKILEPKAADENMLRFSPGAYVYCLLSKFSDDENLVPVTYCEIDETQTGSFRDLKDRIDS